jgi:hypothetical protein
MQAWNELMTLFSQRLVLNSQRFAMPMEGQSLSLDPGLASSAFLGASLAVSDSFSGNSYNLPARSLVVSDRFFCGDVCSDFFLRFRSDYFFHSDIFIGGLICLIIFFFPPRVALLYLWSLLRRVQLFLHFL